MQKVDNVKKKICLFIFLVLYFAVAYTVMQYKNITCVFLDVLGFPCPGCGMTRAFISLVKLDFLGAAGHNVVVFFMPYVFAYVFFDLTKKVHTFILLAIALIAVVNWIIKLIEFF